MKTNLSSQIKLVRIPQRYYAPASEIELASLTRNEKMYTKIFESSFEGACEVAKDIADVIKKSVDTKGHCTIGLGAEITHCACIRSLWSFTRKEK